MFALSIRSRLRVWQSLREMFRNHFLNFSIAVSLLLTIFTLLPSVQPFFGTTSLNAPEIAVVIGVGALSFFAAEVIRYLIDRPKKAKG